MPENNNIIAKKLSLKLDTISQKMIKVKDFVAIIGDSIEITINLFENNLPKDITGASCRLIVVRSDGSYFEQIEKIEVVDYTNGVIKIYPRLDVFSVEGQTICGLLIEDIDETINIQRFVINVSKSLVSDIIIESKDEIETLKRLNKMLDIYEADLFNINKSVDDMGLLVNNKTTEVNKDFNTLKDNIKTQINGLQDEIDGVNDRVNYELTKRIKLNVYRLSGSNFIYLTSDTINEPAKNLLKKQYLLSIGGIVGENTYNTATSILSFNLINGKINPFIININDRTIEGKSLNPSIVFNDLSNSVEPDATGYKILVKSNISKLLNTDIDVYGYLTPLSE